MTALLETPAPTVEIIEKRQPDVPLRCTENGYVGGPPNQYTCNRRALWEGMCMGCGHVFRRCQEHYDEEAKDAAYFDGSPFDCSHCDTSFYLAQYVRIGA